MAASIDMFGTGGEGLGGLFVGNNQALQEQAQETERQKALVDMANTQQIMRQRDLGNQYEEAILPDKIAAYKQAAKDKQETAGLEKFNRMGEQFGRLGASLEGLPAAARPAALRQMAAQAGVGEDNPMLQHLSTLDPNELPAALTGMSTKFYEQGNAARAEKQKRDAMMAQAQMQADARAQQVADSNDTKLLIAQMAADARRYAADQSAAARKAAGGGKTGGGLDKMTTDQRISYLEGKSAAEGLNDAEQGALERLKEFKLNQAIVRSPGTTEDIMGLPSPGERATTMAKGGQAAPKSATKFQEGKVYQDASGNKAMFQNGKWVPVGGNAVPK